ncbi:hypothetical protein AGMMS50267_11410 [Spirochaetia bacterium]|nr:hypothetical protein AGMMS50267_11410 [Spirochaetia bacterium]
MSFTDHVLTAPLIRGLWINAAGETCPRFVVPDSNTAAAVAGALTVDLGGRFGTAVAGSFFYPGLLLR